MSWLQKNSIYCIIDCIQKNQWFSRSSENFIESPTEIPQIYRSIDRKRPNLHLPIEVGKGFTRLQPSYQYVAIERSWLFGARWCNERLGVGGAVTISLHNGNQNWRKIGVLRTDETWVSILTAQVVSEGVRRLHSTLWDFGVNPVRTAEGVLLQSESLEKVR